MDTTTNRSAIIADLDHAVQFRDALDVERAFGRLVFLDAAVNEPRGVRHTGLSLERLNEICAVLPARSRWFNPIVDYLDAADRD